jgi:putative ABC transport system permease protein
VSGVEILRQALRLLLAHKLRSLLTLFGLVWGTAAVIFLVGWGRGVRDKLELGFFKAGRNMGEVWAGRVSEDFTPAVDRRFLWFTPDDVEVLRRRARLPQLVGAEAWELLPAAYRQRALNVDVRGIEPVVMQIRGVPVAAGRGITPADVEHRRRVVLVGDLVRRRLLGAEGHIGSWIRIGGIPFRVVGFLAPVGTQLSSDRMAVDEQVWVPISTVFSLWPRPWSEEPVVSKIVYRMADRNLLEDTEREVRAILASRLHVAPDDTEAIGIWSSVKMLNRLPLAQMRGLFFVLAAATLGIGGIGVMNMMLDSVHERRSEIGLRLAVGARRRDVVAQFLAETLCVSLLGGLSGATLGVGSCLALRALDLPELAPVPVLGSDTVVVALGIMVGVGVAAGVVPAWRAAGVDPASTLRME